MEGEADATFLFPGAGRARRSTPEFGVLGEAQATALRSLHWGVRGASRTSDLQWQLQGQQSFLWVIPLELWARPGAVPPPPFYMHLLSCIRCFLPAGPQEQLLPTENPGSSGDAAEQGQGLRD